MNIILETERLILRTLTVEDAQEFFSLNADPEVIKYTGDEPFAAISDALLFLNNYNHYEQHGYGRWAVILKEGLSFLGWCGLKYTPDFDETDIGFRFHRRYWGKGYASEAASASVAYGLDTIALKKIVGRVVKDNKVSVKVLEKAGLKYWKDMDFHGMDGLCIKLKDDMKIKEFKDYFSGQAKTYAASRPTYPVELFEFISKQVDVREIAWDCATGNGQAAIALAEYFDEVIATDASEQQIQHAVKHEKIKYYKAPAENSGINANSVDLITVATAAHWLDTDAFYKEVERVLKPNGIIAIWTYALTHITNEIDECINDYTFRILKDYWAPEIQLAWNGYKNLPFPFKAIESPAFKSRASWNLENLISYLHSWSATQKYISRNNNDPVDIIRDNLKKLWKDSDERREITWGLYLKTGRKIKQ